MLVINLLLSAKTRVRCSMCYCQLINGLQSICLTHLPLPTLKAAALKIVADTRSFFQSCPSAALGDSSPASAVANVRLTLGGGECGPGELQLPTLAVGLTRKKERIYSLNFS